MQDQEIITPAPENQEPETSQGKSHENVEKDYFDIVFHSVLGFICAIGVLVGAYFVIHGAYEGIKCCYDRWFDTEDFEKIGESGYYYDSANDCIVKTRPTRRVQEGILRLRTTAHDSIGVAKMEDGYRYINLNTATFINDMCFDNAFSVQNGEARATIGDTLYHIAPNGEVLSKEYAEWLYDSVYELRYAVEGDGDEYYYEETESTDLFVYEGLNGRYGLMTKEFVRLTPPVFYDITAKTYDCIFCEYDCSIGVLVDRNGNIIK